MKDPPAPPYILYDCLAAVSFGQRFFFDDWWVLISTCPDERPFTRERALLINIKIKA